MNSSGGHHDGAVTPRDEKEKVDLLEDHIVRMNRTRAPDMSLIRKGVKTIPDSISQLTQLETMDLSENNITAFPKSCGDLQKLYKINLAHNKISTIATSISSLRVIRPTCTFYVTI
eukprot:TRINITY_DN10310_c0_g1_i2.p1 TRINITY_DN10310_c0_g1~~TRINITY_DN10310_c0_g1_i2.p1  ORF type:complete len:116 (+),score=22.75 TRINITY_DN10310_c0_g1_i2:65-412(+)